ncbi:BZ3500_MvSof-1268-A1-R1_Chr9g10391 [Microbotryum saponariae]|uniref:BZ3500_MvSof-1268-A1-R1_Chr9g10391 protein n=1 Tax=Microbotryum saponariae TaxID=289078 RepID=A0A2X0KD21_9BASI|nr:BZ3501_MvSof-1269-A2-R1_Chr9g10141 [Microbotryum saponariae]SDA00014.1 BZ3500_MvSof-1268-A1-R1_Chr9g10391 [Microbotryum saponariae]
MSYVQASTSTSSRNFESSDSEHDPTDDSSSFYVQALYAYSGGDTSCLSFRPGDVIEVLSTLSSGWWDGVLCEQKIRGWFPSNYVQRLDEQDARWARQQMSGWWQGDESDDDVEEQQRRPGQAHSGSFLDARKNSTSTAASIEEFLARASIGDDDSTMSFSEGGDIFSEIAAAARAGVAGDGVGGARKMASSRADGYAKGSDGDVEHEEGDEVDGDDDEQDYWVPKVTHRGQLFYFNSRTGETSRDMPVDGTGDGTRIDPSEFALDDDERNTLNKSRAAKSTPSKPRTGRRPSSTTYSATWGSTLGAASFSTSKRDRTSMGDASVLSAWTERPSLAEDGEHSDGSQRVSVYSQRSRQTTARSLRDTTASGVAVAEVDGLEAEGEFDAKAMEEQIAAALEQATRELEKRRSTKSSKRPSKRTVSTAQLLEPPPPPLLSHLESVIMEALSKLSELVGEQGAADSGVAATLFGPGPEREVLAQHSDEIVAAVRNLLHACGILEHPVLRLSDPAASNKSASTTQGLANDIRGGFSRKLVLSTAAQLELKPTTRRLTSTLSKLVLAVRAVWGLLETIPADQVLAVDDVIAASADEPDDLAQQEQLRQQVIADWARARQTRHEIENKLRHEVLVSTKEVHANVVIFLNEYDLIVKSNMVNEEGAPFALVRAPKAVTGSLRTNAAALLLPGGGFGGNWRGNGFVTLPSPFTTPNSEPVSSSPRLVYAYPVRAISAETVESLRKESMTIQSKSQALRTLVETVERPLDQAALTDLTKEAGQLLGGIASFLRSVEDIDIASGVDIELANDAGPISRSDTDGSVAKDSMSIKSGHESAAEGKDEAPSSGPYRASVIEAKPLLAEFEVSKQTLYNVPPRLLCALQSLSVLEEDWATAPAASSGPQPSSLAPLSLYASPPARATGSKAMLEIFDDLGTAVTKLTLALVALSAIAEVQSSAPPSLRRNRTTQRSPTPLDSDTASISGSSFQDSLPHQSPRKLDAVTSRSPASSRHSILPDTFGLSMGRRSKATSMHSRESADSDFFFSGSNAGTGRTSSSKTRSSLKQLLTSAGLRRGSVATSVSDHYSQELPRSTVPSSPSKPSTPSTPMSKLAKLTGESSYPTSSSLASVAEAVPPWLGPDYGPDEVSYNMEGQIRGATLRALIVAGTSHEGRVDGSYLSAFLMTYRTFCTSHVLLDLLIERYRVPVPEGLTPEQHKTWETRKFKPIRARVANLIKSWVREYMDYDEKDPDLLRRIATFASVTMSDPVQSPQIIKVVDERLSGQAPRPMGSLAPGPLPPSIIPRSFRKLRFLDIDPLELARQLTIMDSRLFAKITTQECLGKAWPKEFGSDAPNISAMIDMSNAVTRWVTETILLQEDLKKRASIVKHFILVAERCFTLNNFSTLIHIIAGLNSTPIHRLRRTWEQVSQKSIYQLGVMNNVMRPDKNYKEYREQLRQVAPPCVPFLDLSSTTGVYLTDWTFIGDGNPDMLRERPHQINFNKRQKASELILMIKLHQATSYNLAAVPSLAKYIDEHLFPSHADPATDDQRLYELSLLREPRERDDEKIARLLSESGFL